MGASDEILLKRWATRRDAEAFAELVRRHATMVFATSLRILRNTADAEEVAQECFLTLVKQTSSGEFCPPKSLGGWIHTIALRRALDRLRVTGRTRIRNEQLAAQDAVVVERSYDDLMEWVDEAIANLPEDLRQAVVVHFLEGRPHREIASELGVSRRTVTRWVNLGIEEVRAYLKHHGVITTIATLCTSLAAESAKAAPTGLTASLGKLALSGANGIPPSSLTAIVGWGGMIMNFKKGIVVLVVAVLFTLGWYLRDSAASSSSAISSKKENGGQVTRTPNTTNIGASTTQSEETQGTFAVEMPSKNATSSTPANTETSRTDTAVLEGTACIGDQPIPNERVQLVYEDSASLVNGVTAADGTYRIKGLCAGQGHVVLGFRDEAQQFRYATQKAILEAGHTTRVDFTFANSGSLEGRVIVDGLPAPKGWVHILTAQSTGGSENYDLELNDDGTYRFEAVSEGNANVKVSIGPFIRTASAVIRAGTTTQLNFTIDSKAGNTITGTITGLAKDEGTRLIAIPGRYEVPDHLSQPVIKEMDALSVAQDSYPAFNLRGLDVGEYTVIAMAITIGKGESIADVLDWRVASAVVTVQEGQENRIDFDLTGEGAPLPSISGTLVGSQIGEKSIVVALKGTSVIPNPLDQAARSTLMQKSVAYAELRGGNTTFDLRHLEPGAYTLLSFAGTEEVPLFGMAVVEVAKEKTATVELKLERIERNGRRPSVETNP